MVATAAAIPAVLLVVTDDQPKDTEWATPETVDWLGDHGVLDTRDPYHYTDGGTVRNIPGYNTTVIKNRALAFLENSRTARRPWFAKHGLAAGQALRARQLRTLLSVDDAMRDFRDQLRSLSQLENTLVL